MIKEGIYTDLSNEDYHADKNSLSRSSIMDFKKSPRNYWAKHLNPDRPPTETKASWEFGTAFHSLILEPHLFYLNYSFELNKIPLLKDVGREEYELAKERRELWKKENKDKIILSVHDWNRLHEMKEALSKNERVMQLINEAIIESSYFWEDKDSGLIVKARPDILSYNAYVDLKTIDDASPENYQREMVKYGYHIQAAMVKDAIQILTTERLSACINVCVEKNYPYSIGVYIIDEAAIDTGKLQYKSVLVDLKSCIVNNEFKDYPIQTIGLPRWAL